ncbi:hypothetical protein PybrP1_008579 [[Pythium] brassicae (nom. inval.)]|nr:hypothetical protein PybrP1_008579 [[Pythium] brassicae (nom. inval.)]
MNAEPTLAAVAQALQDAAQLAGRYGSTTAARERLEALEREHEGLSDAAEAQHHKSALLSAAGFDAERFVAFLDRRFTCRGDLALLLDALVDFHEASPRDDLQAHERTVLLTIETLHPTRPRDPSPESSSSSSSSLLMSAATAATRHDASAYGGAVAAGAPTTNGAAVYSGMGIGAPPAKFYQQQQQSPEEEEQEIHLAAKQLLSPVTFARVEDDDDCTTSQSHSQSQSHSSLSGALNPFVPILSSRSERADAAAVSPAGAASFLRAQTPDGGAPKKLLPKKPKAKKAPRAPSPSPSPLGATLGGDDSAATKPPPPPSANKKRKVVLDENLVIKQNLVWPAERRNISDMKLSSRFLSLKALEHLDRQTPWNEMYKRRPLVSHVVDYSALDERAKAWFVTTLKIQFVWRRELWERLHWLPMSESVCTGAAWERYRQTRKRRAKHAVTAWRKVYAQSIQMIEAGLLPDDVWCDPALWYMPANPVYWLPDSEDIVGELAGIDAKHAVRCYHVYDLRRHPFYALGLAAKYPHKFDLPSFSSFAMPHSIGGGVGTSEEDLASFAMKDHHLALAAADLAHDMTPTGASPRLVVGTGGDTTLLVDKVEDDDDDEAVGQTPAFEAAERQSATGAEPLRMHSGSL